LLLLLPYPYPPPQDPAGHTTPEICSPEYAKYYMATKLASRAKGGAPLKPPVSSQAMDMWSLGCVLYQLCTRRRLVADLAGWSAEEFQMQSADDAMKVCMLPGTASALSWPSQCCA
jgi:serine/threonine protein kinase